MSYRYTPDNKHPEQEPSFIVDVIIIIALLITAAICIYPSSKPQFFTTQTQTKGDTP